ncbi:MBL fold metallo-hydrolase [Leptospira sp. GIMC2001]|uniref:MBL fold metallo-hydrolase n=1 Tax=Leptospira sp. GIMC2001 TaxID=1513297 RepID=UPI00234B5CAF|nr:MBL fold metallo-hydrolase [Leptospira sp. GIMC2001]WCL51367.1 MBL fold metallo-hydrolase [Leptospira sp. GIMC2001]
MPGVACAYLIIDEDRACFVENNTTLAVPKLLDALDQNSIPRENVDYLMITHIHLDHAGGSSALLDACPNAKLLAHPKAAKHAINPMRLIASAKQVYGEEEFTKLYGEIHPVPEERVRVMEDNETLNWQSRQFKFVYTTGHASHHFCIYDSLSNGIFTGDSFGIAYPKIGGVGKFIYPTTTPTDFDPDQARNSLDLILNTGAAVAYLTHFGSVGNLQNLKSDLVAGIDAMQEIALSLVEAGDSQDLLQSKAEIGVREYFIELARRKEIVLGSEEMELLNFDVKLNASGLVYWALKQRLKSKL